LGLQPRSRLECPAKLVPSLLGRPVKLIYYDDQSSPSSVPGIYNTKLLDLDRGDLIIGGYATTQIAPARPVVIQRTKVFVTLFGLAVNTELKHPNYFSMIPIGPPIKTGRHQRILRHCDGAESTAKNGRYRSSGSDRLRQKLSASDYGLRADHPRSRCHKSRPRRHLFLPTKLGRHGEGRQ
jgi:hypothetical protein